jgi:hypothetical protein
MNKPYDLHSWSKANREEALRDVSRTHLETGLRAYRHVRTGQSHLGLAWGGVLSLLHATVPSE